MRPVTTQLELADLLKMLLGRGVTAKPCAPVGFDPGTHVVTFAGDEGAIHAVALIDLGFLVRCGAALALIPRATADAAAKGGVPSALLTENGREVMNVLSQLFGEGTPHVVLAALTPASEVGAAVGPLIARARRRSDFEVSIDGYGPGRVAFVAA